MLPHLANPWILARLVLGLLAALLATVAAFGAVRLLTNYRVDSTPDERALFLDRSSELVAVTLSVAFVFEILAATLTVLASDRLAGSIRGAMCAYGVFGSNPWGVWSLRASIAAAGGCAAWLGIRRVDARLPRGSLVRMLAAVALAVTGLLYADFAASTAYLLGLDLDVVATCCSVFVDSTGGAAMLAADAHARYRELVGAGALGGLALVAGVALWRRAGPLRAALFGGCGLVGAFYALRAATDVVTPYVYEAPAHQCPYCLLRGEASPAGPLLLAAMAAAFLLAVAALAVGVQYVRPAARAAVGEVLARIGRAGAIAWAVVVVAGAYPIVRYGAASGTFDLFR